MAEYRLSLTAEEIEARLEAKDVIHSAIPPTIHIAVGNEFKLYYKNVLSRYTDRLWLSHVNPTTTGVTVKMYPEYVSITAAEETTKDIAWKVYDSNFNIIDSGTMQIIATAKAAKAAKVIIIGDSTVTQSNAVSQKLLNCFSEVNGNLVLLGTRGTAPALHEGRAGWTSADYCTIAAKKDVENPFYNNGFDFSYYMRQQGYEGVDVVVIQLGINDIFSMTYENFNPNTTLSNLDTMINSIRAYNAEIKVIVDLISVPNGNGNSFTDTYYTQQMYFVYLANTIRLSRAMVEHFAGNTAVTISPNNCVLDAKTDLNDGVHPNAAGYEKLGQAIYETMNGIVTTTVEEPEETNELWDAGRRTAAVNTYATPTQTRTISNSCYYYPVAYTGGWTNDSATYDVTVGENSLSFKAKSSAYGVFVPFIGLDSNKKYKFTVNPLAAGFRVYLLNYDSSGVYVSNAMIVDKTTGATEYTFTPTAGYQQGFCFACLSGTKDMLGEFTDLSLVEVTE